LRRQADTTSRSASEKTVPGGWSGDDARDDRCRRHPDQLLDGGRRRSLGALTSRHLYWSRIWQPVIGGIAAVGLSPVAADFPGFGAVRG
jgi:hypothetical protein